MTKKKVKEVTTYHLMKSTGKGWQKVLVKHSFNSLYRLIENGQFSVSKRNRKKREEAKKKKS